MANKATDSHVEKIGLVEKVSYGCGDLASNLILVITSTFVAYFYTDALGLNAGIIGTIMMVSRFCDGFTDMIMGYVMDQVKSKWGKARPWLCGVQFRLQSQQFSFSWFRISAQSESMYS